MKINSLLAALRGLFTAAPQSEQAQAHVIFTGEGLMVSLAWPDGRFDSASVKVHGANGPAGAWAVGRGIALDVSLGALRMRFKDEESTPDMTIYRGGERHELEQLSLLVRQAWMQANNMPVSQPAVQKSVATGENVMLGTSLAAASVPPIQSSPASRKFRKSWVVASVVAAGVLYGGWALANRYLLPGNGPGIDLSSMSVEEVAMLDANPGAVRNVQDSLIEAMGVGREKASESAAKIEESHIEALKAMGLNPGASMQNAISCLAK